MFLQKWTLFTFIFISLFIVSCAGDGSTTSASDSDRTKNDYEPPEAYFAYDSEWKKIEEFETKGLTRSALETSRKILKRAYEEKSSPEIIKGWIHVVKYEFELGEKSHEEVIRELESARQKAPFPEKEVLSSITADVYQSYLNMNRFKIMRRTSLPEKDVKSLETWSIEDLKDKINELYKESLNYGESLASINIDLFDAVIEKGTEEKDLKPTIYDLLAWKAYEYLIVESNYDAERINTSIIDSKEAFSPAEPFVNFYTNLKDNDKKFSAISLLADITKIHIKDKNITALINVELERLEFIYNNTAMTEKDKYYESSLQFMAKKYSEIPASAMIQYKLASYYVDTVSELKNSEGFVKAASVCNDAIAKYPSSYGSSKCIEILDSVNSRDVSIKTESLNAPDKPFRALLGYRNIETAYMNIIKLPYDFSDKTRDMRLTTADIFEKIKTYNSVKKYQISLPGVGDKDSHSTEIKIDSLPAGYYAVIASNNQDFSYNKNGVSWSYVNVSAMTPFFRTENDKLRLVVTESTTGEPLEGVKATLKRSSYNYQSREVSRDKVAEFSTSRRGEVYFDIAKIERRFNGQLYIELTRGNDFISLPVYAAGNYYSSKRRPYLYYFTDRAIYKPGDTVRFKAIAVNSGGDDFPEIAEDLPVTVDFLNVNRKHISSISLTSNKYGSISGSFEIPTGKLNGTMYIQAKNISGQGYVNVEEYKSSTFKGKIDVPEKEFKLGNNVTLDLKAETFTGSPLANATVKYTVTRLPFFPYPWFARYYIGSYASKVIDRGEGILDKDGNFKIKFKAEADDTISEELQPAFIFDVTADITDVSGETHSFKGSVKIGSRSLVLETTLGEAINREKMTTVNIVAKNLAGKELDVSGNVEIYALPPAERLIRGRLWSAPDQFVMSEKDYIKDFPHDIYKGNNDELSMNGTLVSKSNFDLSKSKKLVFRRLTEWKPGRYRLVLKAKDKFGRDVEYVKHFSIYSSERKGFSDNVYSRVTTLTDKVEPGNEAAVLFSVGSPKTYVYFDIFRKGRNPERKIFIMDVATTVIKIPVTEADRGGIAYSYIFSKDGRLFSGSGNIDIPWSNKQLNVTFTKSHDKIKPGEDDEWEITVAKSRGGAADAELLLTAYDEALDLIYPNNWNFSLFGLNYFNTGWNRNLADSIAREYQLSENWNLYRNAEYRTPTMFNYFGLNLYNYAYDRRRNALGIGGLGTRSSEAYKKGMAAPMAARAQNEMDGTVELSESLASGESEVVTQSLNAEKDKMADDINQGSNGSPAVRDIKAQTAFFFPELVTEKDGKAVFKFKAPGRLTSWKVKGLAHTQSLESAIFEKSFITSKELMVQTEAPSFVRSSDVITFATKITNLHDEPLSGQAEISFTDPQGTDITSNFKGSQPKNFSVKPGDVTVVEWNIYIPEALWKTVAWSVKAASAHFSDAEGSTFDLLPDTMKVVDTLPFYAESGTELQVNFDKLKNINSEGKVVFEFVQNPVYYAAWALPYIVKRDRENSELVSDRLYANMTAKYIADQIPGIKTLIEAWRKEGSLKSELEKNSDLKKASLDETPWENQADDETAQRLRIIRLFDDNAIKSETEDAIKLLKKLQADDGGFPWFNGMRSSYFMSTRIGLKLGRLKSLRNFDGDRISGITSPLLTFIDGEMNRSYKEIKKDYRKDYMPGYFDYFYLYMRSYFKEIAIDSENREAFDFFLDKTLQNWVKQPYNTKFMAVVTAARFGKDKIAKEIMLSLKETAIVKDGLMSWNWGNDWNSAPISSETSAIEAFLELEGNVPELDMMKRWLLDNKETNMWPSSVATSDAVYALLLTGTDWTKRDVTPEIIDMKGNSLMPKASKKETATGYFRLDMTVTEAKEKIASFTVRNDSKSPVWGAAYIIYDKKIAEIESAASGLTIEKDFYRKDTKENKEILVSVKNEVSRGERLTSRMVITSPKEMDFIHIRDMRPAGTSMVEQLSGIEAREGLYYYRTSSKSYTDLFIYHLPKGTVVIDYEIFVNSRGNLTSGTAEIESSYTPKYKARTKAFILNVK